MPRNACDGVRAIRLDLFAVEILPGGYCHIKLSGPYRIAKDNHCPL